MSSGYSTSLFLDHIARNHRCGLCRQVMRGPVTTSCGHVFCFACLKTWIDKYGLCPLGCNAVTVSELSPVTEIEEEINGLFVKCTNCKAGCTKIMRLSELSEHQFDCDFSTDSVSMEADAKVRSAGQAWRHNPELPARSSSFCAAPVRQAKPRAPSFKLAPAKETAKTVLTLKVSRVKGESMGFHVVGGEKASDEITIAGVILGFPAHKAGLLDNDKILKVDGVDVSTLMHHEVVDLIQHCSSNPLPVTVERTCRSFSARMSHRYEEIPLVPQEPSQSHSATLPTPESRILRRKGQSVRQETNLTSSFGSSMLSSSALALSRHSFASGSLNDRAPVVNPSHSSTNLRKDINTTVSRTPSLPITKKRSIKAIRNALGHNKKVQENKDRDKTPPVTSNPTQMRVSSPVSNGPDSGLSSGDKSPPPTLQRNSQYRISLRSEKEMRQRQRRASSPTKNKPKGKNRNIKTMGDYEIEEITLHKTLSSRLGVTLGYDEKSEDSSIYVVEILPDGIAAKDARLQVGDIITKVNGFEVYDTEEAILYFLEQDPEIVLSVARPINKRSETTDSSLLSGLRRYDSCGSLDSRAINLVKTDCKSSSSGYNSQDCDTLQHGEKVTVPSDEKELSKSISSGKCIDLNDNAFRLHTPRYSATETQV